MVDSTLKAIAENKIKDLERKMTILNGQLSSKQSFNSEAWAEYGSELCVGEMIKNEQKISDRIHEIVNKVVLLRKFIDGRLDISKEERLKINSEQLDVQIASLQDSKKLIDRELAEIAVVKNLLAVKF